MMSANAENKDAFPSAGILPRDTEEIQDPIGTLSHNITEDIFHNILYDLIMQTHRDEKMKRAASAVVRVEQKASQMGVRNSDGSDKSQVVETDAARWENDNVYLIGNPLKTTTEILCRKCGKQRLLYPTEGVGAKAPEPGIEYCKIRPFIQGNDCDVYGNVYEPPGPGKGHKKEKIPNFGKEGTPNGSQGSKNGSPPAEVKKQIKPGSAQCSTCTKNFPIKRMNGHLAKCVGGAGRESSRSALAKIQNGNGNGNGSGYGSGGSRNTTPAPSVSSAARKSPNKRTASDNDFDDSEDAVTTKKKKKPGPKKALGSLKSAPKMQKTASQISASNLSFEQRLSDDEDVYDDGDDAKDDTYGKKASKTIKVEGKAKQKINKAAVPPKKKSQKPKGPWIYKNDGKEVPEHEALHPPRKDAVVSDESSQTMSSPNAE